MLRLSVKIADEVIDERPSIPFMIRKDNFKESISGITGYQIQMSKNGKKYKTIKFIKKSSTSKFIKKKLKSKKKVYFKIRTYIQSGKQKKYGKWSKVKKVKNK